MIIKTPIHYDEAFTAVDPAPLCGELGQCAVIVKSVTCEKCLTLLRQPMPPKQEVNPDGSLL